MFLLLMLDLLQRSMRGFFLIVMFLLVLDLLLETVEFLEIYLS